MRAGERRAPSVVLDAETYSYTHFGGAIRYLAGLATGLSQCGADVRLLAERPLREPVTHLPSGVPLVPALCGHADVWVTDHPSRVDACDAATRVLVVHDLLQWDPIVEVPSTSTLGHTWQQLADAVQAADLVVTVSDSTRRALRGRINPWVTVPTLTVPHSSSLSPSGLARTSQRESLVLHVGGRAGYKRFDLLLAALARWEDNRAVQLVNVGGPARFAPKELASIAALGLTDRVHAAGFVSDEDLVGWYERARVVAVVSDGEGFGLPMLEALTLGASLVAPDLPVTYEVTRGAAETFQPGDSVSLTAALRRAWARRPQGHGSARGHDRAWSWEQAGRSVLAAATEVAPIVRIRAGERMSR